MCVMAYTRGSETFLSARCLNASLQSPQYAIMGGISMAAFKGPSGGLPALTPGGRTRRCSGCTVDFQALGPACKGILMAASTGAKPALGSYNPARLWAS
ncbi:hypothetical protein MAPG_05806 [Magnaporthiopsis poae ATCC 64411]|uniref:Uncharacterized protein n=1 Tax=Magnaporthiopsis poae (strain ATCC 64411 / 73-15) TaxID=644358 RepID=A0A0C4E0D3_MAGP6|nr:hypothetical protein MAPG_05806 [Magnaporthiopsis poae ATCC 64411]